VVAWLDGEITADSSSEAQREAFLLGKGSNPTVLAGVPFADFSGLHVCMRAMSMLAYTNRRSAVN
jgi:hypothetical protein